MSKSLFSKNLTSTQHKHVDNYTKIKGQGGLQNRKKVLEEAISELSRLWSTGRLDM